jgi:hypothetical protein
MTCATQKNVEAIDQIDNLFLVAPDSEFHDFLNEIEIFRRWADFGCASTRVRPPGPVTSTVIKFRVSSKNGFSTNLPIVWE